MTLISVPAISDLNQKYDLAFWNTGTTSNELLEPVIYSTKQFGTDKARLDLFPTSLTTNGCIAAEESFFAFVGDSILGNITVGATLGTVFSVNTHGHNRVAIELERSSTGGAVTNMSLEYSYVLSPVETQWIAVFNQSSSVPPASNYHRDVIRYDPDFFNLPASSIRTCVVNTSCVAAVRIRAQIASGTTNFSFFVWRFMD